MSRLSQAKRESGWVDDVFGRSVLEDIIPIAFLPLVELACPHSIIFPHYFAENRCHLNVLPLLIHELVPLEQKKNPETTNYRQEVDKYADCIQPASLFVSTKRTFLRLTSL